MWADSGKRELWAGGGIVLQYGRSLNPHDSQDKDHAHSARPDMRLFPDSDDVISASNVQTKRGPLKMEKCKVPSLLRCIPIQYG